VSEITPASDDVRVHHHQLHLVNEATFRPNAAQRPAHQPPRARHNNGQNANDLAREAVGCMGMLACCSMKGIAVAFRFMLVVPYPRLDADSERRSAARLHPLGEHAARPNHRFPQPMPLTRVRPQQV